MGECKNEAAQNSSRFYLLKSRAPEKPGPWEFTRKIKGNYESEDFFIFFIFFLIFFLVFCFDGDLSRPPFRILTAFPVVNCPYLSETSKDERNGRTRFNTWPDQNGGQRSYTIRVASSLDVDWLLPRRYRVTSYLFVPDFVRLIATK